MAPPRANDDAARRRDAPVAVRHEVAMRLKSIISWSDNMTVGVTHLDDEHKTMIDQISCLYAYRKNHTRDEVIQRISELIDHTILHFDNEEKYMKKIGYPDSDEHYQVHRDFLEKLTLIEDTLMSGQRTELSDNDLNSIARWLFNHILAEDRDYAIRPAHREAEAPVPC